MPFPRKTLLGLLWAHLALLAAVVAAVAEMPPSYREGSYEQGRLEYVGGLPVLSLEGTPEQIARQKVALVGDAARRLSTYPRRLLKRVGLESQWPHLVELGRTLSDRFPPDHRREFEALFEHSDLDRDLGLVINTMTDTYRSGFGCSSLHVAARRSATGGPLLGRNLDFLDLGMLHRFGLVAVYRPEGKHAFVSVGFPGLMGCLSGMNDAGLCLAVHEVYLSRDGAAMFNPRGVPYTLCFRRVLEECGTVAEAERLIRRTERTTLLNLILCDRREAVVLEITPKTVAARRASEGILACTNHFRSKPLAVFPFCPRYRTLTEADGGEKLGVADLAEKLDQVNQGERTVQAMIFEPVPLKLHVAVGACPASAQPFRPLPLGPLFSRRPE